jgi:hypothetical protein
VVGVRHPQHTHTHTPHIINPHEETEQFRSQQVSGNCLVTSDRREYKQKYGFSLEILINFAQSNVSIRKFYLLFVYIK